MLRWNPLVWCCRPKKIATLKKLLFYISHKLNPHMQLLSFFSYMSSFLIFWRKAGLPISAGTNGIKRLGYEKKKIKYKWCLPGSCHFRWQLFHHLICKQCNSCENQTTEKYYMTIPIGTNTPNIKNNPLSKQFRK